MKIHKFLVLLPIFFLSACNPFYDDKPKHSEVSTQADLKGFTVAVVPDSISGDENRRVYLAKHYWDNMDVDNGDMKLNRSDLEENFVNYLNLLQTVPEATYYLNTLMDRVVTAPVVFRHFISLSEKHLYRPESPVKNEEWYITVLEYVVHSAKIDTVNKIRPRFQLKMLYKNRLGKTAENFKYIDPDGQKGNLYTVKAQYTLLFFYDPDCEYCKATIAQLRQSQLLNDLQLNAQTLKILAVYTEANSKLWLEHVVALPSQWLNVSDQQQITLHHQYDLKALPTLYLLDEDKKVLLKDASLERIEDYLYAHQKDVDNSLIDR